MGFTNLVLLGYVLQKKTKNLKVQILWFF